MRAHETLTGLQEGKLSQNPNQGADFYKIFLLVALQILLYVFLEGARNVLSQFTSLQDCPGL